MYCLTYSHSLEKLIAWLDLDLWIVSISGREVFLQRLLDTLYMNFENTFTIELDCDPEIYTYPKDSSWYPFGI